MKFSSPEELEEKVEAYFAHCDENNEPYTISGLALALDTTRCVLLDYEGKDGFSNTIKMAKAKCEAFAEKRLYGNGQVAGAIFNLTNNYERWSNKQDVNHGGQKENPVKMESDVTASILKAMPLDQLEKILKENKDG